MPSLKRDYSTTVVPVQITGTAGAYSANDVMGGLLTVPLGTVNTGGLLGSVRLRDNDDVRPALVLYVFDAKPTVIADNAAFGLVDTDSDKLIGTITIAASDWTDFTQFGWVNKKAADDKTGENIDFRTADGTLYVYAKCTATPTMTTTTALKLYLTVWGD